MTFSTFCPQLQRISLTTGVKMKSLIILFFVIAAVFADSHEQDVFEAGQTYLMLGSNNKFLSLINYGGDAGYNYIESTKTQQDVFCRFVASTLHNGKVALTPVGTTKYLQLSGNTIQPTAGAITTAAQFEVEVGDPISEMWCPGAHFVHLKAANGNYWGFGVGNRMVATFNTTEEATRLIVLEAH